MAPILSAAALVMVSAGTTLLAYQRGGRRRCEMLLAMSGIALGVCGLVIARDLALGSPTILWVLSPATPIAVSVSHVF